MVKLTSGMEECVRLSVSIHLLSIRELERMELEMFLLHARPEKHCSDVDSGPITRSRTNRSLRSMLTSPSPTPVLAQAVQESAVKLCVPIGLLTTDNWGLC